jgi:hypothetical protein
VIRFGMAGLIALATGALIITAVAQEQPKQSDSTAKTHLSYVPELADLMNITQTRFFRLSYAPEADNWELAAYEAAHLRKTFDIAVKLYPVFGDVKQKKLIHDATEPALNSIDRAIRSRDLVRFSKSRSKKLGFRSNGLAG